MGECQLYAFVDAAYLAGRPPTELAEMLCDSGADLLQLRAKDWPAGRISALAERLIPITERAGVRLVINDYPSIAAAVGAPFCHLGQEDFFDAGWAQVDQVRARFARPDRSMPPLQIGLSTHAPNQAGRAVGAGADYVAIGPVFATGTKPQARPVTLDYVRWAAAHVAAPWFAIGGITLDNLDLVLEAGAERICVVSAILCAPDPGRACQQFKERLVSARRDRTS